VKKEKGSASLYPATARLTFGYLSTASPKADLLAEANKLIALARERARSATEFWDRVGVPDWLVVRHRIGGDLAKQLETILSAYDDAWHGGVKPGEFSSVMEHIEFLRVVCEHTCS
jgi:hypothetical protein